MIAINRELYRAAAAFYWPMKSAAASLIFIEAYRTPGDDKQIIRLRPFRAFSAIPLLSHA